MVADLVAKCGEHSSAAPDELIAYIKNRQGYNDSPHHGRAGHPDTAFVSDEPVDRFCFLGLTEAHKGGCAAPRLLMFWVGRSDLLRVSIM